MRTLVVSDLHLGVDAGRAVLDDPGCRRALAEAVAEADRLVLLGDVVELRERPLRDVLPAALPTLEAIGQALAADASVVVLAGNHDHRLVEPWLRRRDRGVALGVAGPVTVAATDPLQQVVRALGSGDRDGGPLGGDRVTVAYPGTWPRPDVWATHGHYADRHTTVPILERLSAGAMARVVGEPAGGPARSEDYEAALAPVYAWIDALAEHRAGSVARAPAGTGTGVGVGAGPAAEPISGSERAWRALADRSRSRWRRRALGAAFPPTLALIARGLGSGPLSSDLSGAALRRGPLRAIGEVTRRLEVPAAHVVFGHTHRAGPLPADDPAEWRTPAGAALINSGCWVRPTAIAGPDTARSPYRPGFAVWIDSDPAHPPELVNLLD